MTSKSLLNVLTSVDLSLGDLADDSLISSVTQDSRTVSDGGLFVAIPGFSVDGHDYLESALERGAAALLVQADHQTTWQPIADAHPDIPVIAVEDTRAALPQIAAAFNDFPARQLTVVGVTGTDGKSTTCYLTHAMLSAAGHRVGLLSGVEFQVGGQWTRNETGETTPEADVIQAMLAEMVAAGDTHVVIEVSSHALELHRVDGLNPSVAVFTGLSDDHLDFHGSRDNYLAAKLKLFQMLDNHPSPSHGDLSNQSHRSPSQGELPKAEGVPSQGEQPIYSPRSPSQGELPKAEGVPSAVVRAEDPLRPTIESTYSQRTAIATADASHDAEVSLIASSQDATGSDGRIVTPAGALGVRVPMPGDYNLGNAALAAGAAWTLGVGPVAMQAALRDLRPVPGRMEPIDEGQPFNVIVDAAATGPALDLALQTLTPHVRGRLILIFGVAGERDPVRKSSMAAVAARLADLTIITNENPRSEDPAEMVDEIASHMAAAGSNAFERQPDRRRAIERAIEIAATDDLVLIAGKGAEPTMIFADRVDQWDDRDVARQVLQARLSH